MSEHTEEPEVEAEAEDALGQASPAAVSIALGKTTRGNKAVDAKAVTFLDEQTKLLRLQTEHLHEQRELQLAHLRVRRWKDRVSLTLQCLGAAAGVVVAGVIVFMVWDAANYRGLEVEAFYTPPGFSASGLDGRLLASRVTDRIADMDATSQSFRARSTYENNWAGDIKIEVPDTGVSFGELRHYLREWLGHPTRVTGEAARTPVGLSLTVRAGDEPGFTVSGSEAEVDRLVQQAAEKIFSDTQPYQYSKWLENHDRKPEALEVARKLALEGSPVEQAWAWAQVSNLLTDAGQFAAAVEASRRGLAIDPHQIVGLGNMAFANLGLDHEEMALTYGLRGRAALERGGEGLSPLALATRVPFNEGWVSYMRGDFSTAIPAWRQVSHLPDFQGVARSAVMFEADALVRSHDASASRRTRMTLADPDVDGAATSVFRLNEINVAPEYFEATEIGDWAGAAAVEKRVDAISAGQGLMGAELRWRFIWPRWAEAMARSGDQAGAEALIARTPMDCDQCVRSRGRIASLARDWPRADAYFAQAVRQSPSVPFGWSDWGRSLLDRGDPKGAAAKAEIATEKSPHFADAYELWGEALLTQGAAEGATEKFEEAAKYAPRWGHNRVMWARALLKVGDASGAHRQLIYARGMDLTPQDRAAVN